MGLNLFVNHPAAYHIVRLLYFNAAIVPIHSIAMWVSAGALYIYIYNTT